MGIQGLSTFIRNKELFERNHRLHDTVIVVDGHNLLFKLYFKYQREKRNSHMYGGDYALFAAHVRTFFSALRTCGVEAIVLFDGSFDPSLQKMETLLKRFGDSLQQAWALYKHNTFDEGLMPLLNEKVFKLTLDSMGIVHYQSIYEADDAITAIAHDLGCPVLSNDSDFLVERLAGGVISLDYLIDDDFHVCTASEEGVSKSYKYINTYIYRSSHLHGYYPKLNLDLVPVVGAILGNDHISQSLGNNILRLLPKYVSNGVQLSSNRQKRIHTVFTWLSTYDNKETLISDLRRMLQQQEDRKLLTYIEEHFRSSSAHKMNNTTNSEDGDLRSQVTSYFASARDRLFFFKSLQVVELPVWVHEGLVENRIRSRLLRLRQLRIDWFSPLVEDFSIAESSAEVIYDLSQAIYGILVPRTTGKNCQPPKVKRYCRRNTNRVVDYVPVQVSLQDNNKEFLLPTLEEIELLSVDQRHGLFFLMTGIDKKLPTQIGEVLAEHGITEKSSPLLEPFISALLAAHYLTVHFSEPLWLEFLYALLLNLILCGHIFSEPGPVFLPSATLFEGVEGREYRQRLHETFYPFSDLPSFSHTRVFMPRLVHLYNAYQNCLYSMSFLAEVLNIVKDAFPVGAMLTSLKGTFLYNMTANLSGRKKPLDYITRDLLGAKQKDDCPLLASLFRRLLSLLVEPTNSRRRLLINSSSELDSSVVPESILSQRELTVVTRQQLHQEDEEEEMENEDGEGESQSEKNRFFVRAFEASSRQTHIDSQWLKVKNRRRRCNRSGK